MSFAANLKKHRLKKGYSLQGLADQIGVSKGHLWDLETARAKNPSLEVLTNLSTKLDVSIAALVGEMHEDDDDDSSAAQMMFRELKTLNESDRDVIKVMMERLKQQDREKN